MASVLLAWLGGCSPAAPAACPESASHGSDSSSGDESAAGVYPTAELLAAGGTIPVPPRDLNDRLRAFYPAQEWNDRVGGEAFFRMQIDPDGTTSNLLLESASGSAFAAACLRMLMEIRWSPGRDAAGDAVPVQTNFRCMFTVE